MSTIEEVRKTMASFGVRFDPEVATSTRNAYRPLLEPEGSNVEFRSDVAYGSYARQKLDLYVPTHRAGSLRIMLFVPGGGFVRCEKDGKDGFYGNIGRYFARRGFAFAVMNYRVAPQDAWPAGHQDVGLAVKWLQENAAEFGADANDVAVFGQSAGACHTLSWYFDPRTDRPQGISAILLASGTYSINPDNLPPNIVAYFGDDPATFEERSALSHVTASDVKFLLMAAELDPPYLASPTFELAAKLCAVNGKAPRVEWLAHHNHVSPVFSIGTPDDHVARLIGGFMAETRR